MKNFLSIRNSIFIFFILLTVQSFAQTDSVRYGFITMNDESSLSGKIISETPAKVTIKDFNLGEITVETKLIASMEIIKTGGDYRFTLSNGKIYSGKVVNQTDSSIDVSTQSIGTIHIKPEQIKDVLNLAGQKVVDGKLWFPNPHGTRYLFMPSAIPLKKGDGYFQNVMLDVNSMVYGVSDHVSVGIGFAVPFAYMLTARFGYKVAKNIHVGGGGIFAGSFFNVGFGLAAAYGNVTFGNENSNVSIAAGYGAEKTHNYNYYSNQSTSDWNLTHGPLLTFCGMHRVGNRFALISENWFFPVRVTHTNYNYYYPPTYSYTYNYDFVLSFGFRTMWEKSSFDLAVATESEMIGSNFPAFPYLDYVFKF